MSNENPPTLSVREAADALGVHYMTAYRYVRTGVIPAEMVGGRWRINREDLDRHGAPEPTSGRRDSTENRRERLLGCLVAGDEQSAWYLVEGALVAGMDPVEVHLELLSPTMRTIGERWEAGTLSVGQEHKASAVCQRLVGRLGPRFARPGRRRGVVVLAGAPQDPHSLPVALAADVVRAAGYSVVDMGAAVPADDLAAEAYSADRLVAVAVTVTTGDNEAAVAESVAAVRGAAPGVPILVGGRAVHPALAATLGVHGFGVDANELLELLEVLQPVA